MHVYVLCFVYKANVIVKYFMAFTLCDVKMLVVLNVYRREHYQMCFVLKCPSFTLYVAFLIAILMVLLSTAQICKYLVFCWHPKLMPMQISKLLALATVNANAYKCV